MLIDWFTVGAQLVNFVILIWLMKRFLYGPILAAIDAREARIAAELADANAKRDEAKALAARVSADRSAFDAERDALMTAAKVAAEAAKQKLLADARQVADTLRARQQAQLEEQAKALNRSIVQLVQSEVFAVSRKVLSELADDSLEQRLCAAFVQRLREVNGEAKTRLEAALGRGANAACVRSAFALSEVQRHEISAAVAALTTREVKLQFESASDVVAGIELSTEGEQLSWSVSSYLSDLERRANEIVLGHTAEPASR